MRDVDRQISLRKIIDRLPLGERQRRLAEESFENMTEAEAKSTVELYDQVAAGLPAALAAARRIRGMAGAPQANVPASPEPTQHTQEPLTNTKPVRITRDRKSSRRFGGRKQPVAQDSARIEDSAYYSPNLWEAAKPHTVSGKAYAKAFYKKISKAKATPSKDDAWQMAKMLSRITPKAREQYIERYIDENRRAWSVFHIEGYVNGYRVEAVKIRPSVVTRNGGYKRFSSRQDTTIAVSVDGQTTYSTEAKAIKALQKIGTSGRSLDNALTLLSSSGHRR